MIVEYFLNSPLLFNRIFLLIGFIPLGLTWAIVSGRWVWFQLKFQTIANFLVQFTILYPQLLGIQYLPIPQSILTPIITISGLVLFFLGILIAIWGRITMGKAWGLPGSWDTQREKRLITSGPFKHTRNPIYVGLLFAFFGFELALNSYLSIAIILLYFYFKTMAEKEEKILEKEFGKEYLDYKRNIPRFL